MLNGKHLHLAAATTYQLHLYLESWGAGEGWGEREGRRKGFIVIIADIHLKLKS